MTPAAYAAKQAEPGGGARRLGAGRRAAPAPPRRGRRRVHAGKHGGAAGVDPQVVRRARGRRPQDGSASRKDRDRGVEPARAPRHRRRSREEPRAHPPPRLLNDRVARGRDLDLAGLIGQIQSPPSTKWARSTSTLLPAKERFELATTLNNLLAAPAFETWIAGEPLDVSAMLYTAGAGRGSRSSRSRTCRTPSGCSSWRSC